MKALIWKELRENWKWAGLAALVLGVAMYQGMTHVESGWGDWEGYDSSNGATVMRKQFLIVTAFGFPTLGLLLGFVQILPELRRDRWAALLHRPVGRSEFFFSKVVPGCLLYAFAGLVPFALMAWYAATPGNFAVPFVPEMLRPGLADFATGLAYYFAAIGVALNRQGWKLVGVFLPAAAIFLSTQVLATPHFWAALSGAIAMTLLLMLAAWGIFLSPYEAGMRPRLLAAASAIAVVYGAFGIGGGVKAVLLEVIPSRPNESVRYMVMRDVGPVRVEYVGRQRVNVTAFDGSPLDDSRNLLESVRRKGIYLNRVSHYVGDSHGWEPRSYPQDYRDTSTYLFSSLGYQYPEPVKWFFIRKYGEWVGFRKQDRVAFAWFDGYEFAATRQDLEGRKWEGRTAQMGGDSLLLFEPRSLRVADLQKKQIDGISPEGGEPYSGFTQADSGSVLDSKRYLVVGTPTQLDLFDEDRKPLGFVAYTQDVGRLGRISVGGIDAERFMVQYDPSTWIPYREARTISSVLEEVNLDGEVLASYELKPLPPARRFTSVTWRVSRVLQSLIVVGWEYGYRKVGSLMGSETMQSELSRKFDWERPALWRQLAWMTGISAVLAGVTFGLGVRWRLPMKRAIAWALLALGFNVGGFVAFLLATDRMLVLACPSCGKRRRVDRSTCNGCGADWERPPESEMEIILHDDGRAIRQPEGDLK